MIGMTTKFVAVSEEIFDEFHHLVFQEYRKFGFLRTEVDNALKKRIAELKQELAVSV